jgi:glycerol-3-phosphate dehydrogenase
MALTRFSTLDRDQKLKQLANDSFDLLVIGGGITGAGIALDAASRGLKAALVEKNDFAFGTSSRSTKLIHGGLRYLKQLEFALVKEVGSERAIVHKLAPHLVVPEKMLLPLYEKRGLGYWLTSIGLRIYDWLAGVKSEDQRKMLTKIQTMKYEPLLKSDDIKGGAIYAEYRTDDARLTIEIAKVANEKGAVMQNYVRVTDFEYTEGKVTGAITTDELTGKKFSIKAGSVVNAAGPWVDELREINRSKENKHLHLTKGVHIVVPYHRLPVRQAIYFDVPDGRMIFAIPRGRITYIGTTDTDYDGEKDKVFTSSDDARYLLNAVNVTFPSSHLTLADVESCWAGLRPLIHEEGKSASELSRKDEIFESESGLISIAGGKLTGYRKMSERVVDLIIKLRFVDRELRDCSTSSIYLAGGGLVDVEDVQRFHQRVADEVAAFGLKGDHATYLVHLYGKQADAIIAMARDKKINDPEIALALAELDFALEYEMIATAEDFLVRRTGLLYFNIHRFYKVMDPVLDALRSKLSWSEKRVGEERKALQDLIANTLRFKN